MRPEAGFRRKVFYLSGYDPRGARFYHQLHAEQAAIYAANSRHAVTVGERRRAGANDSAWTIEDRGERAVTEYEVLGWDDLIRKGWRPGSPAVLWQALAATARFSLVWDWRRFRRYIPIGSFLGFYYPALSLVLLPILLIGLIWSLTGPLPAVVLGPGMAWLIVRNGQGLWLARFVTFNDGFARGGPMPDLEARLDGMAETVVAALAQEWDEVLLVTHSNGSILAVPLMDRLLARLGGKLPGDFALMTLGSCIPLVGGRKDAERFNAMLGRVAEADFLWLDLGSKTDGACLPLVDPCITADTIKRPRLHVLSPRWFKYCDPATYRRRRRDKYETHFEYLRTFDRISPLDYIRVTSCGSPLPASIEAFGREPK